MGKKVDLDDLLTTEEVARALGLAHSTSINLYRHRADDFPRPVVDRGQGRCLLWLRADIEAWRSKHPARRRS